MALIDLTYLCENLLQLNLKSFSDIYLKCVPFCNWRLSYKFEDPKVICPKSATSSALR